MRTTTPLMSWPTCCYRPMTARSTPDAWKSGDAVRASWSGCASCSWNMASLPASEPSFRIEVRPSRSQAARSQFGSSKPPRWTRRTGMRPEDFDDWMDQIPFLVLFQRTHNGLRHYPVLRQEKAIAYEACEQAVEIAREHRL